MGYNDSKITNLMKYSATNNADVGTRYYGGSNKKEHPFVKGYFQAFFELPALASAKGSTAVSDNNAMVLTASASSFTPHGDRSLNKTDIVGQGNVGASYVSGQTTVRTFSLNFQEKYRSPVWKVFRKWSSLIIDPYTGLSNMSSFEGADYKGRCLVVETMPVRLDANASEKMYEKNIIKVFYYDGVFLETDVSSIYDSNIQSPDANLDINMSFSFDGQPLDDTNAKTLKKAISFMKNAKMYSDIMNYYDSLYTK